MMIFMRSSLIIMTTTVFVHTTTPTSVNQTTQTSVRPNNCMITQTFLIVRTQLKLTFCLFIFIANLVVMI